MRPPSGTRRRGVRGTSHNGCIATVDQIGSVIDLEQHGRTIRLSVLQQDLTYAGLLGGTPNSRLNRRMIDRTVRNYQRDDRPLHVITPTEVPIPELADMGGRPAMAVPSVRFVANFTSLNLIITSGEADGSHLTVLWFSERLGVPIDPDMLDTLRHLDWGRVAADFPW